jgi:hypothetical protein
MEPRRVVDYDGEAAAGEGDWLRAPGGIGADDLRPRLPQPLLREPFAKLGQGGQQEVSDRAGLRRNCP